MGKKGRKEQAMMKDVGKERLSSFEEVRTYIEVVPKRGRQNVLW